MNKPALRAAVQSGLYVMATVLVAALLLVGCIAATVALDRAGYRLLSMAAFLLGMSSFVGILVAGFTYDAKRSE